MRAGALALGFHPGRQAAPVVLFFLIGFGDGFGAALHYIHFLLGDVGRLGKNQTSTNTHKNGMIDGEA